LLGDFCEFVDVSQRKHEGKTEEKLDKLAFSKTHPDLAERYAIRGA
jgi:hypothetical protein